MTARRGWGRLGAVVLGLVVALAPALAQEGASPPAPGSPTSRTGGDWPEPRRVEHRGVLSAQVGHGCLATLPDEVERVALADDAVARVQIISPREILLTGLVPGSTTVHVWLADGRRLQYLFRVGRDLDLLRRTLKDLDPAIEAEAAGDGTSVVLRGEVASEDVAREATLRARAVLAPAAGGPAEVLNLLRFPGAAFSIEQELAALLHDIDARIRVRRIQVDVEPDRAADTFVLEGRVRTIEDLVRAVVLAERQLGGTGGRVRAASGDERVAVDRRRGFLGGTAFFGGGGSFSGDQAAGRALSGVDPRSTSLAAQIARGQVITSESGRVISLLEVDDLHQVLVSIRVLEVDRTKTRKAGINFRIDAEHVSIGSYQGPGVSSLPGASVPPSVTGVNAELGNLVGAFVDQTQAILAAVDFLQERNFARAVAEPNVLTLSGELASVVVGGEVPIPATAANQITTFQGFFFQDFGVRLDIRPTVSAGDMVALEVAPSIVSPAPGVGVQGVPGFKVQSVTTTARVQAGQSLLLGGLLAFEEGLEDRRLPGLGKIPLFRWKRKTRAERELLFLITPRIVRIEPEVRADAVVDPTPDLAEIRLPPLEWPEERSRWRDAFEPVALPADGIAVAFRADPAGDEIEIPDPEEAAAAPDAAGEEIYGEDEAWEMERSSGEPIRWRVAAWVSPCLNFRSSPGLWTRPLDCLPPGTTMTLLATDAGWKRVRLEDGREGWVAGIYLEALGPEVSSHDPAPGPDEPDKVSRLAAEVAAERARLDADLAELDSALAASREIEGGPPGS